MIVVFFTEDGYYMAGEGIEIARSCSPALTERGDRIFQPLHHEYKVLYLALSELRSASVINNVMVYGNSRIIDEVNGTIKPLDSTCERWLEIIRRDVVPTIKTEVLFRKKALNVVQRTLIEAHNTLLPQLDRRVLDDIIKTEQLYQKKIQYSNKQKILQRFKEKWFKHGTQQ